MLLPSAIGCDAGSNPSSTKSYYSHSSTALFASPPISPPAMALSHNTTNTSTPHNAISSIFSTCRALQSMLTTPAQLPSPPTQHMAAPIISSPFKLRLRQRGLKSEENSMTPRKKISKRPAPPPRGINKRRRAIDDDMSRGSTNESDVETEDPTESQDEKENTTSIIRTEPSIANGEEQEGPQTPKRRRLAPEVLPLGLERKDFHALHLQHQLSSQPLSFPSSSSCSSSDFHTNPNPFAQLPSQSTSNPFSSLNPEEEGSEQWTQDDDRLLVELVLEKLKLSKSEWQDCARSLGKDRGSVGRRWKSLMAVGDVGLKGRPKGVGANAGMGAKRMERRGIYGSWR